MYMNEETNDYYGLNDAVWKNALIVAYEPYKDLEKNELDINIIAVYSQVIRQDK
jgi:hypothetical protein